MPYETSVLTKAKEFSSHTFQGPMTWSTSKNESGMSLEGCSHLSQIRHSKVMAHRLNQIQSCISFGSNSVVVFYNTASVKEREKRGCLHKLISGTLEAFGLYSFLTSENT